MPGERSYPEFGQCVHKVARHPERPERLYLQNHGGVYRSDDGGDSWPDIAPRAAHASSASRSWSHPHDARDGLRLPDRRRRRPLAGRRPRPGLAHRPTRARAGSRSATGLPDDYCVAVMRDAMCADDPRPAPGSTSAAATAPSGPRPTRARPGPRSHERPARRHVRAGRRHLSLTAADRRRSSQASGQAPSGRRRRLPSRHD